MTKAEMITTLQARETEAWTALHDYHYIMCPRTDARDEWERTDGGYNARLATWGELNELLKLFNIEPVHNPKAADLAIRFYAELEAAKNDR